MGSYLFCHKYHKHLIRFPSEKLKCYSHASHTADCQILRRPSLRGHTLLLIAFSLCVYFLNSPLYYQLPWHIHLAHNLL